jgi:putative peptidoglycan lipid II flippase
MRQKAAEAAPIVYAPMTDRPGGVRWGASLSVDRVNRRIFVAMMIVAGVSGLVKLATVGRDVLIAHTFGTGDGIDAFLTAMILPSFLTGVVLAPISTSAMPTIVRLRTNGESEAAARLAGALALRACVLSVSLSALLALVGPLLLPLLPLEFSPSKAALIARLLIVLAPMVALQGVGLYWGGLANAADRFAVIAAIPLLSPLLTIALLLAAPATSVWLLVGGMVGGAAAEMVLLAVFVRRIGFTLWGRWSCPELAPIRAQYLPLVTGAAMMSGTVLVDQMMAARLGAGSIALLSYAGKILAIMIGLGAMPLGTALLPSLSRQVAAEDWTGLRHTIRTWTRLLILVTVPLTAFLLLESRHLIAIVFEHGEFTAADTDAVASLQSLYALQIPFHFLGILGVRTLSALHLNRVILMIATSNFVANIALNLLLMRWLGLPGVALATSIVYISSTIMIFFTVVRHLRQRR